MKRPGTDRAALCSTLCVHNTDRSAHCHFAQCMLVHARWGGVGLADDL